MQPIFPETTLDKSVVLFYNKCKNPGAAAAAGNAVFRLKEYMRGFMYTYFIADDETKIRQGLRRLIDWEELGFFCVGEASNGEDALAVILEKKPDIALLDIRMPRLSGLDVARLAREKNYEGTILILSGYSDFKYAQEAMCYDVKFYITKPVDEDDLTAHLLKIREELDEKKKRTSAIEYYSEKARSGILRDFLTGSSRTLTEELKELGLLSGCYQAAIYEKYSHDAAAVSYRFSDLLHLTNEDNHSYETLTIDHNEIILLKGDFAIRRFSEFVERFEREVKPQKGSPLDSLFITYGRVVYRPEDITGSYREALYLLQMRFYCDPSAITSWPRPKTVILYRIKPLWRNTGTCWWIIFRHGTGVCWRKLSAGSGNRSTSPPSPSRISGVFSLISIFRSGKLSVIIIIPQISLFLRAAGRRILSIPGIICMKSSPLSPNRRK